ncbi:MAG: 4a-hydroxytetrahydrobiopterin dehydratase [Aquificaceae bacterium]
MSEKELKLLSKEEILSQLPPGWSIEESSIKKTYQTKSWLQTVMLFNCAASLAQSHWHHPDISVSYRSITIVLTTHEAKGITYKDVELAKDIELYFNGILQR